MPVPRFWSGSITQGDLDASLIGPLSAITPGGIGPDALGLHVWNATGGTLTKNTLVYVSGWNAANALFQVSKAFAGTQSSAASYVVLADILNGAGGIVGKHLTTAANLNTNAATVGDPVWLNTVGSAGGFTLTSPPLSTVCQRVGRVRVKSATVGVIEFDLVSLQVPMVNPRQNGSFPTITTTGTLDSGIVVAASGSLTGVRLNFKDVLAANNTNYVTFTLTNKTTGAGTAVMLATSPAGANSTQVTGGTAIAAWTAYDLTLTAVAADLVVVAGDLLLLTATVTGTLANTVTEGVWSATFLPI